MTYRFKIGFAIGDVGLNNLEHFLSGFGELDEDPIVDLKETKELHHFTGLGCHFVDTVVVNIGKRERSLYPLIRTTKTSFG